MKNDPRLKRYALAATTVPVAALATTAPVAGEIIFEDVDLTVGGFVVSPETTSLNIGGYDILSLTLRCASVRRAKLRLPASARTSVPWPPPHCPWRALLPSAPPASK